MIRQAFRDHGIEQVSRKARRAETRHVVHLMRKQRKQISVERASHGGRTGVEPHADDSGVGSPAKTELRDRPRRVGKNDHDNTIQRYKGTYGREGLFDDPFDLRAIGIELPSVLEDEATLALGCDRASDVGHRRRGRARRIRTSGDGYEPGAPGLVTPQIA